MHEYIVRICKQSSRNEAPALVAASLVNELVKEIGIDKIVKKVNVYEFRRIHFLKFSKTISIKVNRSFYIRK